MSDLWSFSQTFSSQFQISCSDLESRISSAKASPSSISQDVLQTLSIDLAKLTKSLADATGSLPSYGQRQYEKQLKELEQALSELRAKLVPKSKFAFKRKETASPANATRPVTVPPVAKDTNSFTVLPTLETTTANLTISSRSYEYITLDALPKAVVGHDLAISDLDHCIVNLIPPREDPHISRVDRPETPLSISALHIRNLTDTVLLLPLVDGSALLHDLSRCTIVMGCRQFRMHASQKVDVYLSIPSNPIIEHCSNIRFAAYPTALLPSPTVPTSNHFSVQDFSHIRATPSPNWRVMNDDQIPACWPLVKCERREEVDEECEKVLPS
ncbi:Tubulin-folding cofactor C [Hypsizygus marmoreus]|uniref:Tubulin-folding cofactor C n=1 Tax=Hypsizygus marmoreus TaxID=39966 RepID=A0A369JWS6_HYPMA|nr:Tubulin-folding cofactor C [Hypsizygus marmoreus]